jgi:hypothetical protein
VGIIVFDSRWLGTVIYALLHSMPQVGVVLVLKRHSTFICADQPLVRVVLHVDRSGVVGLLMLFWLGIFRQRVSNVLSHLAYFVRRNAVNLCQLAYDAAERICILVLGHLALNQAHLLVALREAYFKEFCCPCCTYHFLF